MADILGLPEIDLRYERGKLCGIVLSEKVLQRVASQYPGLEALVGIVCAGKVSIDENIHQQWLLTARDSD